METYPVGLVIIAGVEPRAPVLAELSPATHALLPAP
jgi:hypothetical protein